MTDPVKKYEELRSLTEGWFNNFFKRAAPLPSNQQRAALSAYQEKYQVLYLVKDLNKKFNANDLMKGYQGGQIKNNTLLKKDGTNNWIKFGELLNLQPFNKLKQLHNDNPNTEINPSFEFINYTVSKKPLKGNLGQLAQYVIKNNMDEDDIKIKIFNPNSREYEWIKLTQSGVWNEYRSWKRSVINKQNKKANQSNQSNQANQSNQPPPQGQSQTVTTAQPNKTQTAQSPANTYNYQYKPGSNSSTA